MGIKGKIQSSFVQFIWVVVMCEQGGWFYPTGWTEAKISGGVALGKGTTMSSSQTRGPGGPSQANFGYRGHKNLRGDRKRPTRIYRVGFGAWPTDHGGVEKRRKVGEDLNPLGVSHAYVIIGGPRVVELRTRKRFQTRVKGLKERERGGASRRVHRGPTEGLSVT